MPINTAALKTFAPAMRRQLLEAVGRKLDLLLNSQTPDTLSTYARQVAELREQEADNREQLLERVAYTWFNRLCALRYLDARGWHPFGCKVLMPAGEGETQPELLKLMRAESLPVELKAHTNESRLHGLLDGQIPTAIAGTDPQGEVYRGLVLASCRFYHQLLPNLFEVLDDATELLVPDDLLTEGSIAGRFRTEISDEDCQDVEIIGWLYQFYISERKDQIIGKAVKTEDVPVATQLFTPNWIVKYMVQNTLGAQWLATYPDSPLKGQMEYYIEPAEQKEKNKVRLAGVAPASLNPEELTIVDPACGSGHILAEAYEVFKAIYKERGYALKEIPRLILTKNLFGVDLDPRAAQLAAFALLMKGREDDKGLLRSPAELNILSINEAINPLSSASEQELQEALLIDKKAAKEINDYLSDARVAGSLCKLPTSVASVLVRAGNTGVSAQTSLLNCRLKDQLHHVAKLAAIMSKKYSIVIANPPYLAAKYYSKELKSCVGRNYKSFSKDLFSCFIDLISFMACDGGRFAAVTPHVWMFLSSHEQLRRFLLSEHLLVSLVKPSYTSFFDSAIVSLVTFACIKAKGDIEGVYIDLGYLGSGSEQPLKLKQAINEESNESKTVIAASEFEAIPGCPLAFNATENMRRAFRRGRPFAQVGNPRVGMQTSNNDKYVRFWHEISWSELIEGDLSSPKWIKYLKGGSYRKWYGNLEHVLLYNSDPDFILSQKNATLLPIARLSEPKCTWSDIASGAFSARLAPVDTFHDIAGHCFYPRLEDQLFLLAYANSKQFNLFMSFVNSTVHYQVGDVGKMPILPVSQYPESLVTRLVDIAKKDWNQFERSWDFNGNALIGCKSGCIDLRGAAAAWLSEAKDIINEVLLLEEKNNEIFISAYGLKGEVDPSVAREDVTLDVNPYYRYGGKVSDDDRWKRLGQDAIKEFLSYATGCMIRRYSLDQPGLILADSRDNQAAHLAAYEDRVGKPLAEVQFKPDPDGIIPVLDGEWFEDDIVARTREFLDVTFPESSVTENLRFIEESLAKDIRKYFCSDFYKDHLQTYKKRPIYWMVQSSKKGFACLIYLHRYTKDTLNQVLNNYFRPYLQKLEARLAQLGLDQLNDSLPTRDRTAARKEADKITKVLKECQAWEQDALLPLAQQRIELDLDDGVKVNYLKLQDVLVPIPGLAAKED